MEARVLRAALSAAIRVTISTSLLGCGGRASTDFPSTDEPEQSASSKTGQAGSGHSHANVHASGGGTPTSGHAGSIGAPHGVGGTGTSSAGATNVAGMAVGGAAGQDPTGAAGAAGAGGTPASLCGGALTQGCFALLEAHDFGPMRETLDDPAVLACCVVISDATWSLNLQVECANELLPRFDALRGACCSAPETWQGACAPWGPPVPPELSHEQLLAWQAVA